MSDKPREWPNVAKEQRDQAAEAAVTALRALRPVVTGEREMSETERLRREAQALTAVQTILMLMAAAGAPVRAIDL
jgi:hypothetical protein